MIKLRDCLVIGAMVLAVVLAVFTLAWWQAST
jgi:hypothetical protein